MADYRVLWINEHGNLRGGCEQYIHATAQLLAGRNVESLLVYDPACDIVDPSFLRIFDGAFPIGDLRNQVRVLDPNLIYVHRLTGAAPIRALAETSVPTIRFFHDHKLFCLREHKYTAIHQTTCTRPVGFGCYPCLGFLRRGGPLGVSVASLRSLRAEQNANKALAAFAVGSRYMAGHLALHGFDPARTHVLPLYAPPSEPVIPVSREPNLLLFVGQLVRGKGLDTLLHAMKQIPPFVNLLVLGTGRQEAEFRKLAVRLGIQNRVHFAGVVDRDALDTQYRRAACLVFPSRSPETFGLVGPEAMRFATPIVAANVGGVGEWLKDNVTGLAVPPNDPGALAKTIERVLIDRTLAMRLGENAQASYEKRFRPEYHVDLLLRMFATVMENKS